MKKWIFILAAVILVRVIAYNHIGWIYGDDCKEYLNSHYEFKEGKIKDLKYLMAAGDYTGKGYNKYVAVFENGQVRLLKVNVKMHNHIIQLGPDYKVLSWEYCEKTDSLEGLYTCESDRGFVIRLKNDGTFLYAYSPFSSTMPLEGKYYSEDGVTIIISHDVRKYVFLADDDVLVFLNGRSDEFNKSYNVGNLAVFYSALGDMPINE